MRVLLGAAVAAVSLCGLAFAEEGEERPAYTVLRSNASVLMNIDFDRSYTVQRDGSLIFHIRDRWFRARLTPPCSTDLYGSLRLGFVTRGPWFDRASQVIVDDHRCPVRSFDEIADPRPESQKQASRD